MVAVIDQTKTNTAPCRVYTQKKLTKKSAHRFEMNHEILEIYI